MLTVLFLLGVMYDYRTPLESKVDPRCYQNEYVRAWVHFTDKNVTVENYGAAIEAARRQLTDAAAGRRSLRRGVTDYADIPVCEDYIREVEANGGLLIARSKWLNAASFHVAREDLDAIARLDFVHKITRVAPFRPPQEPEGTAALEDTALYGLTYNQLQMFGVERVHEMGIFGSNVRIGFLDTGLRRTPLALSNVNVVAEHDFLEGDQIFCENTAVTERYGVYSDLVFHAGGGRWNLFLAGDTVQYNDAVRDLLYTYSTDNGATWQPTVKITNNYNNWVYEVDVCGRDTVFVFYRTRREFSYPGSRLSYIVYDLQTGSILSTQALPNGTGGRQPSAVQIDDTVYVAYHTKDSDSDTTRLMLSRGTLAGFGQESAVVSATSSIQAPEIVAGTAGFGIFYHTFPEDSLYFVRSSMPPDTFTALWSIAGKDAAPVVSGDTIFLAWKETSNAPLQRVAFALSTDLGTTFTPPLYLSDGLNAINRLSLARSSSTVTVAWETAGTVYRRTSLDNGLSFGAVETVAAQFACLPLVAPVTGGPVTFYALRGDSSTDGYALTSPDHFHPRHGTEMLGLVGGYFSGRYIGVAPGAEFIVAKTENPDTNYEFPVEEDTYVAGLEWCEAMGADIVSSSLGYSDWYTWPRDFDGRTSPASIAAYEATRRGLIVVTAAGNVSIPRLEIPGDAMGVITVGGLDSLYSRWEFSGYGPTFDGRMKPEIMCLSAAPIVVNPDSADSYLYSFGTSGATAMITGICALLLEAHPNWTVDSVKEALFSTASFYASPTDSMGYGWPDAYAAVNYSPVTVPVTDRSSWLTPHPNPFFLSQQQHIYLPFRLHRESIVEFRVYSIGGRLVRKVERTGILLPGTYTGTSAFMWDGTDEDGEKVGSGLYYCVLLTHGAGNDVVKFAVVK